MNDICLVKMNCEGRLAKLVEELDVSHIVKSILDDSPHMAYHKFPLDAIVRAFIWAEINDIRCCYHLAHKLDKCRRAAKALNLRTHLRYPDLSLRQIIPTGRSLELFKERLSGKSFMLIHNLAMELKDQLNLGGGQ